MNKSATEQSVFIHHPRLSIMATTIREPECVLLKRRGAEHVEKLIAGLSLQKQLAFWQRRTQIMRERQEKSSRKPVCLTDTGRDSCEPVK